MQKNRWFRGVSFNYFQRVHHSTVAAACPSDNICESVICINKGCLYFQSRLFIHIIVMGLELPRHTGRQGINNGAVYTIDAGYYCRSLIDWICAMAVGISVLIVCHTTEGSTVS